MAMLIADELAGVTVISEGLNGIHAVGQHQRIEKEIGLVLHRRIGLHALATSSSGTSFDALGDAAVAIPLREALVAFAAKFPEPGNQPVSFVATFNMKIDNEHEFAALWLQSELRLVQLTFSPCGGDRPVSVQAAIQLSQKSSCNQFDAVGRALRVLTLVAVFNASVTPASCSAG